MKPILFMLLLAPKASQPCYALSYTPPHPQLPQKKGKKRRKKLTARHGHFHGWWLHTIVCSNKNNLLCLVGLSLSALNCILNCHVERDVWRKLPFCDSNGSVFIKFIFFPSFFYLIGKVRLMFWPLTCHPHCPSWATVDHEPCHSTVLLGQM